MLPPLLSVEMRVRLRSPTMMIFSRLTRSAWVLMESQQAFFSTAFTRIYTLKRLIISFESQCYNFKSNQWVLRDSKMRDNFLALQRVASPLEAPQAEIAFASHFLQSFLLTWKKTEPSSLVSWMRSMSGVSILIKLLMASSLVLLPIPLHL